jgi:tagatose 1,6-diphosphate aldolase
MKNLRTLSLGKRRGLAQCADAGGTFSMLALDHRQVIKQVFPGEDSFPQAVQFKKAVIRALSPVSSAFLLDPGLGAGPSLADDTLAGSKGLIVAVEKSGYAGPSDARISRLPDNWSVTRIKRLGASAVKLLVYYNARSSTAAAMQDLVGQVQSDCDRCDIPLFLEILTYSVDPSGAKLAPQARIEAVVQAAADLTPIGGDILKAEFPVDVIAEPDQQVWLMQCQALDAASSIPWVLLSAAVNYEVFLQQATIACQAGASGILAGRAIWKEALEIPVSQRDAFLCGEALERMQRLQAVCAEYGRPYTDYVSVDAIAEDWYDSYPEM